MPFAVVAAKVVVSTATALGAYFLSKYYIEKTSKGGVIQIKTKKDKRILKAVSSVEFISTVKSIENCSIERIEFRGHGNRSEISPFTKDADDKILLFGDSDNVKVVVEVNSELVDLGELLRCKMSINGEVRFKGCFTGLDIDSFRDCFGDSIARELSKEMSNVKVYGYPLPAYDIRALLQPFGFTINPRSIMTNVYVDGEKK